MVQVKAFVLALGLLLLPAEGMAQDALVTVESGFDVAETAERLVAALEGKGIKVAARIDHAAGARAAGLEMRPTQVVMFGNPKLGTPLMLANPEIAVDLPMKIAIWQDEAGRVLVGYLPADALKARYRIDEQDEVFQAMAGALAGFAKAAAGTE